MVDYNLLNKIIHESVRRMEGKKGWKEGRKVLFPCGCMSSTKYRRKENWKITATDSSGVKPPTRSMEARRPQNAE